VERNVRVDHVTIWRWVQRYAPELAKGETVRIQGTTKTVSAGPVP